MAGDGEGWITSVAVPTFSAVHSEFESGGLGGMQTERFVLACDTLVTVFERLGMTFQLAAVEVAEKKRHLTQPHVLTDNPTVGSIIANDLKEDKVSVPQTDSRNLHCLMRLLAFVVELMSKLVARRDDSLYTCASSTYAETLACYHTTAIRWAIKSGLWLLPSRAHFLHALNETEESAKVAVDEFLPMVNPIVAALRESFAPHDHRCLK